MGAAAKTCCCKNSAENKSVDLRTDGPDVTKEMKEKSKIINPYFKSLALDSEINQVYKIITNRKIKMNILKQVTFVQTQMAKGKNKMNNS